MIVRTKPSNTEPAAIDLRRPPDNPFQQGVGINAEGVGELEQRVASRDALTTLQLTDRSSMEGGEVAKVFLADPGSSAVDAYVRAEATGEARRLDAPARCLSSPHQPRSVRIESRDGSST